MAYTQENINLIIDIIKRIGGDTDPSNNAAALKFLLESGNGEGGEGVWGGIEGNLPDQLDLQAALDLKANKPSFTTLVDGVTVNWNTLSESFPEAKLTSTQSFTLNMTNVASGAQGVLKLITGTASSITITFDSDFTNKSGNSTFTAFSFPAETGKEYYISFIVDGTTIEWNFPIAFNSDLKFLPADVSTSADTAQNITGFSWTLLPNTTYRLTGVIKIGCNNTGGVKVSLTAPALASCYVHTNGRLSSATGATAPSFNAISAPGTLSGAFNTVNSPLGQIWMDGIIITGANGGTLQMTFASGVVTQLSTIYSAGSLLKLER